MGKSYYIQNEISKNDGIKLRIPLYGTIDKGELINLLNERFKIT